MERIFKDSRFKAFVSLVLMIVGGYFTGSYFFDFMNDVPLIASILFGIMVNGLFLLIFILLVGFFEDWS